MPVLYEAAPADSPSRLHRLLRQPPDCTPSLLCSPADTIFRYRGRIGVQYETESQKNQVVFCGTGNDIDRSYTDAAYWGICREYLLEV